MSHMNRMDQSTDHHSHPHRRRGVVAVFVTISLVTLLMFASLAIDVGYICALTAEQQNTADAAALAGCSALRENVYADYYERAASIITRNQEFQGYRSLEDQIIEVGRWDKGTMTFTAVTPAEAISANAVRVVAQRSDAPLFFASIMGKHATTVNREAIAMVTPSCNGIWAIDSIKVPGTVSIDSYDSTAGLYDAGSAGTNGDLCSNGSITVSGSADIFGDVLASDITLNGGALTITGISEESIDPVDAPPIDFSDVDNNNDNNTIGLTGQGNAALNSGDELILGAGDNVTLPPGTFYFKRIDMTGDAWIGLSGQTTIYLDGDLEMTSNAIFNTTTNPAELEIISSATTIKMTGNVEFYGSIYAPFATISLKGNSDYYGALVGSIVDFGGNFSYHVDESLQVVNTLKGPVLLVK